MTPKTYKIVLEDVDNGSFRDEVVALADYEALAKAKKISTYACMFTNLPALVIK